MGALIAVERVVLRVDGSLDVVPARYQLNADETIDIGGPNMAGRWSLPGGRLA